MESGRSSVAEKKGTNDVVVTIAISEEIVNVDTTSSMNPQLGTTEMARFSSGSEPTKLPKIQSETNSTQKRSLLVPSFTKPKSRLVEPPIPRNAKPDEEEEEETPLLSSPTTRPTTKSVPPVIESPSSDSDSDDEEVYKTAHLKVTEKVRKKVRAVTLFESIAFVSLMGVLICSLSLNKLKKQLIWGLELWKWCVLVLVILCGRLFTIWSLNFVAFLIESNFLLKKKVLYFVYGLKKSVQIFIWLGLVLVAWDLLINRGVHRSHHTTKILNYVSRALASSLIGSAIWLLKTLLIKTIASKYQCNRFFDRIQESIFHQYAVMILSAPPPPPTGIGRRSKGSNGRLSFRNAKKEKEEEIDIDKLIKMKQAKCSSWTMKGLVDIIRGSGLSTVSSVLNGFDDEQGEEQVTEISNEKEARSAASRIFRNVARHESEYIEEDDLLRFMRQEEVDSLLHLVGAQETLKIKRSTLKNWLVSVYKERKALAHSLKDAKTAIEELDRVLSAVGIILAIIVWLLLMGFLTTKILLLISSQLLLVGFMFGNAAKTVFEAIIFVFVMHPFDVGDRCVIDQVQMVVEEMNILTTVFLRYDNEKIFYPNSVLSTKPISNFYRSPDMGDAVEFAVHISTSSENIVALKAKIKAYLESKPEIWRPDHTVLVKEIEDLNKIKMALCLMHTMNFQDYGEKSVRRSELVLELKKNFEELGIKYHLLPQEVHLIHADTADASTRIPGISS